MSLLELVKTVTSYQILGKYLSLRLKCILPNIVWPKKVGFIKGRFYNDIVVWKGMECVGVQSHSWIAAREEPDTHQFYVTICLKGVIEWIET
jgi:hypothetical protein